MTTEGLLGGLVGSLLTVIVTKILDLYQNEKNHEHSLKKSFFDRKLMAAENAVARLYSTSSFISALSALYDHFSVPDNRAGGKVFDTMNQTFSTQLSKIGADSVALANSIYLYFDIDTNTLTYKEPMKKYFDLLIELQDIGLSLDILQEIKGNVKGTEDESIVDSQIEKARGNAREKLKHLSEMFDSVQVQINQQLQQLRTQMKKYDN